MFDIVSLSKANRSTQVETHSSKAANFRSRNSLFKEVTVSTTKFYDIVAPFYHLIYPDWDLSIKKQGKDIENIVRSFGISPDSILDVACGIGTQSLGLAQLGYRVTASDLSAQEIERCKSEATKRGLSISASVVDMRQAYECHQKKFDCVIACDNSIPHLLSDAEILSTLKQLFLCTKVGGLCLISIRDYTKIDFNTPIQLYPHGVREESGCRYILFQVWKSHLPLYDTTLYVIEHHENEAPIAHSSTATYYAISIEKLIGLMNQAGFAEINRVDNQYFQPVIVARKR